MKNVSTSDVVLLLQAIAWPMCVLVVALIFRKGFTRFLVAQRIAKLSLPGWISIDFRSGDKRSTQRAGGIPELRRA